MPTPYDKSIRREKAWSLLREGLKSGEIAKRLNVHPATVSQWRAILRRTSETDFISNKRVQNKGRARALTAAEETTIRHQLETVAPEENGGVSRLWDIESVKSLVEKTCGKTLSGKTISNYLRKWEYFKDGYMPLSLRNKVGVITWWKYVKRNARLLATGNSILWYNEASLNRMPCSDNGSPSKQNEFCILAAATSRGTLRWMVYAGAPTAKKRIDFLSRIIDSCEGKKIYLIHEAPKVYSGRDTKKWLGYRKGEIEIWELMDPKLSGKINSVHRVLVAGARLARLLNELPARQRQQLISKWKSDMDTKLRRRKTKHRRQALIERIGEKIFWRRTRTRQH